MCGISASSPPPPRPRGPGGEKLDGIKVLADKINGGLHKLHQAGEDVRQMKIELGQKEVKLVEAQKETDVLLIEITESTAKAQKKQAEVCWHCGSPPTGSPGVTTPLLRVCRSHTVSYVTPRGGD